MCISHIMIYDKFTEGYIDFFQCHFSQYNHRFLIIGKPKVMDCQNNDDIIFLNSVFNLWRYKSILDKSEKIIISGLFQIQFPFVFFNRSIQQKTYIQFWGGDYTRYVSNHNIKTKIEKLFSSHLVKHCAGIINLIDEEYDEFSTVFPRHNKHFVAPMATSLRKIPDYSKYIIVPHDKQEINIMIGNSATQTNHHVEIFELLKEMKPLNFHVYCPLSYGDKQYAETVTQLGKQYFGDHFHSLSDYLDTEDYLKFLEEMDIGIFNVNRQQAMGNINRMLYFGKKVYLNRECVLWQRYFKRGFIIHAIEELKSAHSISRISIEEFNHNIKVYSPQDSIQLSIDSWNTVFKD